MCCLSLVTNEADTSSNWHMGEDDRKNDMDMSILLGLSDLEVVVQLAHQHLNADVDI